LPGAPCRWLSSFTCLARGTVALNIPMYYGEVSAAPR
jgi:hypothetical protein